MSRAFWAEGFPNELQDGPCGAWLNVKMVEIQAALAKLVDRVGRPRARRNPLQSSYAVSRNFGEIVLDGRLSCCFEYFDPIERALPNRYAGLARQIILRMHGEIAMVIFMQIGKRVRACKGEVADIDLKFDQCRVGSIHQDVVWDYAVDG